MLGCTVLFGQQRGAEVKAMIEEAIGGPCPCTRDEKCPLLTGTALVIPAPPAVLPEAV